MHGDLDNFGKLSWKKICKLSWSMTNIPKRSQVPFCKQYIYSEPSFPKHSSPPSFEWIKLPDCTILHMTLIDFINLVSRVGLVYHRIFNAHPWICRDWGSNLLYSSRNWGYNWAGWLRVWSIYFCQALFLNCVDYVNSSKCFFRILKKN